MSLDVNMDKIVARHNELQILKKLYNSHEAEFLAIYGRRRVGKTILIDSFCKNHQGVYFSVSGTKGGLLNDQLSNFIDRMSEVFYHGAKLQAVNNWREAFKALTQATNAVPINQNIMIFLMNFHGLQLKTLDYYKT